MRPYALKATGLLSFLIIIAFSASTSLAQTDATEPKGGYEFKVIKELPATPVKDQFRSSTCWSFSTISLLESELIRQGKGQYDLSEMFTVRMAYSEKARKYVRLNGHLNMAGGGAFHDVSDMIREYGIVPEEVYPGTLEGEAGHVHGEMDFVFKSYLDAVIANKNKKLSPVWHKGFNSLLDVYLGEYPDTFTYGGKQYTPASYAKSLGLKLDDYVQVTSYTHHPFYAPFALEVPDNWAWGTAYNVPLDELVEIIDYSIEKGYTVAWASDISEKGFSFKNGVAIVPEKDRTEMSDAEILKWEKLTEKDKEKDLYSFTKPGKEKVVTQEMRQEAFDNYLTTDDHGMHITGTAKDQNGTPYYLVKNSWADNSNSYKGYFYVSVPFVRYKTLDIMVHKDAIPAHIRKKLGI